MRIPGSTLVRVWLCFLVLALAGCGDKSPDAAGATGDEVLEGNATMAADKPAESAAAAETQPVERPSSGSSAAGDDARASDAASADGTVQDDAAEAEADDASPIDDVLPAPPTDDAGQGDAADADRGAADSGSGSQDAGLDLPLASGGDAPTVSLSSGSLL